jgi:hypothetical protein
LWVVTGAPVVAGGDPGARPVLAAQVAIGQWLSRDHPHVLVKTARKHALLGGAVQAVVADLDHAHVDVGGAPGVVDLVAAQRHAEVADLPLGELLAEHFPQVVAVDTSGGDVSRVVSAPLGSRSGSRIG